MILPDASHPYYGENNNDDEEEEGEEEKDAGGKGGYSNDDRLKDEARALKETKKSAKQTYRASVIKEQEGYDLALLIAMGTGALTDEELQLDRMDEYVTKKLIPKRKAIKVSQQQLKNEITIDYCMYYE